MNQQYRTLHQSSSSFGSIPDGPSMEENNFKFNPVQGDGVFTFHNVCIEDLEQPYLSLFPLATRKLPYNVSKQIIIYGSRINIVYGHFLVRASQNIIPQRASWNITFTKKLLNPEKYKISERYALFEIPTCPGNLYHFWEDEFLPLYALLNATNLLESPVSNQLIYRYPWDFPEEKGCYDINRYGKMLQMLNIHESHDWFGNVPSGICFKTAVFGLSFSNKFDARSAISHVIAHSGLNKSNCVPNQVTLIRRSTRRIMNIHVVRDLFIQSGFKNVNIIDFSELNIKHQIQTAACSKILVGVQGAGLQWSAFMDPGSLLIEVAWPRFYWNFYFKDVAQRYGLRYLGLEAVNAQPNWQNYVNALKYGQMLTQDEKSLLMESHPKSESQDNIWKFADVMIDVESFVGNLTDALNSK